ncbi:SDR family NAD(P)-dependent oxidoreductase [Streptomyces sp. NPDC001193]
MDISGSNVLLTGATGGIGSALAATLTAQGARLTVTGRRPEALKAAAEACGARTVVADLAVRADVVRLAETCADADVLVANAALPASGDLLDYTGEQVDRALDVNLRAPLLLSRLLAAHMVARGRGHIVLVGSISGKAATKSTSLSFGVHARSGAPRWTGGGIPDSRPPRGGRSLVSPDGRSLPTTGIAGCS